MRLAALLFAVVGLVYSGSGLAGAQRRGRIPKPPDLTILECSGHRSGGQITIDGRLKNTGEKPFRGIVLSFDFFAPNRTPLTTQKAPLDEETVEPGAEAVFRVALNEPPRAVEFDIGAQEGEGRELRVANAGPHVID